MRIYLEGNFRTLFLRHGRTIWDETDADAEQTTARQDDKMWNGRYTRRDLLVWYATRGRFRMARSWRLGTGCLARRAKCELVVSLGCWDRCGEASGGLPLFPVFDWEGSGQVSLPKYLDWQRPRHSFLLFIYFFFFSVFRFKPRRQRHRGRCWKLCLGYIYNLITFACKAVESVINWPLSLRVVVWRSRLFLGIVADSP